MTRLALVDSGRGNLTSVEKALAAAGGEPRRTADPDEVRRADRLVVPGQGAFADAMSVLVQTGLDDAIREFIASGRPYLGICLGLQLLFDASEEHGETPGLGVIPGRVERIGGRAAGRPEDPDALPLKVPHMGWNDVFAVRDDPVLHAEHYYFVHSFAAAPADRSIEVLRCDYGETLCAAIRSENIVACQFHPEKSQRAGLAMLSRFMAS